MDVIEIIKRLGGSADLAVSLNFPTDDVGAKRIRAWGARSSIPVEYWLDIVSHSDAVGAGVTLDVLATAHARAKMAA